MPSKNNNQSFKAIGSFRFADIKAPYKYIELLSKKQWSAAESEYCEDIQDLNRCLIRELQKIINKKSSEKVTSSGPKQIRNQYLNDPQGIIAFISGEELEKLNTALYKEIENIINTKFKKDDIGWSLDILRIHKEKQAHSFKYDTKEYDLYSHISKYLFDRTGQFLGQLDPVLLSNDYSNFWKSNIELIFKVIKGEKHFPQIDKQLEEFLKKPLDVKA